MWLDNLGLGVCELHFFSAWLEREHGFIVWLRHMLISLENEAHGTRRLCIELFIEGRKSNLVGVHGTSRP